MSAQPTGESTPLGAAVSGEISHGSSRHLGRRILTGLVALAAIVFITYATQRLLQDGDEVRAALKSVSPAWGIALLLGSVLIMIMTTATTAAPLPKLAFSAAFLAQHASQAVASLVPGPAAMAARFGILRTYGVDAEDFGRATVTVGMVTTVVTTSMPLFGLGMITLIGANDPDASALLPVAIGATVLALLMIVVSVALLSSVRVTIAVAHGLEWLANLARRLFHRTPVRRGQATAGAIRLRTRLLRGLRESGRRVVGYTLLVYWCNGLLIVACLWAVGVPYSAMGLLAGLAVYTIGRLSTLVQVTPGGIGVIEVAYTAAYTAFLGSEYQARVFTAVLLYRLGTYALPLVVGVVSAGVWALTGRREWRARAAGMGQTGAHRPPPNSATQKDV